MRKLVIDKFDHYQIETRYDVYIVTKNRKMRKLVIGISWERSVAQAERSELSYNLSASPQDKAILGASRIISTSFR